MSMCTNLPSDKLSRTVIVHEYFQLSMTHNFIQASLHLIHTPSPASCCASLENQQLLFAKQHVSSSRNRLYVTTVNLLPMVSITGEGSIAR